MRRVHAIDSHTGGEPTRVVIAGGPDLGRGPLAERLDRFRGSHDEFRSAVANEPRGSDVMVGALLAEPDDPSCSAAVIFFNNVGTLGMCGHGTIGLIRTLQYLGRIEPGEHRVQTPVGIVTVLLHSSGAVSVENVTSYRYAGSVSVDVPGLGRVTGDVAWGGNWFFLVGDHGEELCLERVEQLTLTTRRIRAALMAAGIHGAGGHEIDHIELFSASATPGVDSRNFVLCPGDAYDRSPCGTGTSAKLACLFADGKLDEGETWRQESITGSIFTGTVIRDGDGVRPTITGDAWITAETTLILDPADPISWGLGRRPQ